jgi:thiol:disulfide interchange protein DsbC
MTLMRKSLTVAFLVCSVVSGQVFAEQAEGPASVIRQRLLQARPDLPVGEIVPGALPGFYSAVLEGGQVLHFTEDGRYFFAGDLYEVTSNQLVNVSEQGRTGKRKQLMSLLDESQMLVFAPPKERIKATITVFTDIDCGFCRKLHKEVPELNRLGIAIRYLAYPRAGMGSDSYDKYVSAWCADNPKIAFTKAKAGQEIEERTCANPVAEQFQLGGLMGIDSTPSLIYDDGRLDPGYLPAEKLAAKLGVL